MAKLLLNLRHVLDDEADDVRAFLDASDIAYYETSPGFWNISLGGIWIRDDDDLAELTKVSAPYEELAPADAAAKPEGEKRE